MTCPQVFQEYGIWGSFWGLGMGIMLFVLSKLVSPGRLERGIEAVDQWVQGELCLIEMMDIIDQWFSVKTEAVD